METRLGQELGQFLKIHLPNTTISNIDEVVLNYVASVLESLGEEDSSFDVDQFIDMISAYVPGFSDISSSVVCEWVFSLVAHPDKTQSEEEGRIGDGTENYKLIVREENSSTHECPLLCSDVENVADEKRNIGQKRSQEMRIGTLEVSTKCTPGGSTSSITHENFMQCDSEGDSSCNGEGVALLMEMFPEVREGRVRRALQSSMGDVEKAVQNLLEIAKENSEKQETEIPLTRTQSLQCKDVKDDQQLKQMLLARYAYVAEDEDKVTHRPFSHKTESKKLVRYRDNQVVNTKGERYTIQTKKDCEGENMKKTYMNLKPFRKYRFH